MDERFIRTGKILGDSSVKKLSLCRAAVFGIGGVGGYACETLARSGVKNFDLIDGDTVNLSNINRQIIALTSTVGRYKADVMKERILDISPDADVRTYNDFFLPGMEDSFPFCDYDYIIEAIDMVKAKVAIITKAKELGIPIISAMGAGNKVDGTAFKVADISDTKYCPLARVMRRELKKRGITSLKTVYSEEMPIKTEGAPGSVIFATAAAGLLLGSEAIKDLIKET